MADGMGCNCFAHNWEECSCSGVDWTPSEMVSLRKEVAELRESLGCIVVNALLGPDVAMCGATDCFHVPCDDILEANRILDKRGLQKQT